jgi:hypothetical protein
VKLLSAARGELFGVPQTACLQPNVSFDDGAPPPWGLTVRQSLNKTFPNRWIVRDGTIPRPSRSPDITLLDFFLSALRDRPGIPCKSGYSMVELRAGINTAGKHVA